MTVGIYAITNTTNGKPYIGSSANIERRWKQHRNALAKGRHHSIHLQRAWDIDGPDAFQFTILEECAEEELFVAEQRHVDARKSADGRHGYNVCVVVQSRLGTKHTEESKARMSEVKQGQVHTEETKRLMSTAHSGKRKSPEHAENIRLALLRRAPITEETRAKLRAANARVPTPESNEKRSAALKGKPKSPETIAKMRASRQAGIAARKAAAAPASAPDNESIET